MHGLNYLIPWFFETVTSAFELLPYFGLFAVIPACFLAFTRRRTRLLVFLLGLVVYFVAQHGMHIRGADNPALFLPLLGMYLSMAALLGEPGARLLQLVRRWRRGSARTSAHADDLD